MQKAFRSVWKSQKYERTWAKIIQWLENDAIRVRELKKNWINIFDMIIKMFYCEGIP